MDGRSTTNCMRGLVSRRRRGAGERLDRDQPRAAQLLRKSYHTATQCTAKTTPLADTQQTPVVCDYLPAMQT